MAQINNYLSEQLQRDLFRVDTDILNVDPELLDLALINESDIIKSKFEAPVLISDSTRTSLLKDYYRQKPTQQFLDSQIAYLSSLQSSDRAIIAFYSSTYGSKLMNGFLRGEFQLEQSRGEIYNFYLNLFELPSYWTPATICRVISSRLKQIIDYSPPVDRSFYLWNGAHSAPNPHYTETFISTSIHSNVALLYAIDTEPKYFSRFMIPEGKQVLFVAPLANNHSEREVVIPYETDYITTSSGPKDFIHIDPNTRQLTNQTVTFQTIDVI